MAFPHKREKIAGTVRKWIDEGKFQPGDRFPSDQELARKFKVTHITVRSAIQPLVEAGILERRIGFGTLVRKPRPKGEVVPETGALGAAVGVAIPDNTMSFFSDLIKAIEASLFATGRPFLLGHHWELGDREDTLVRSWTRQGLRRAILVPLGGRESFYRALLADGVRLVFVDRSVTDVDVPSVTSRDEDGSTRVTKLLIDLGHRRLVHLAGPAHASTANARAAAFQAACDAAGVSGQVVTAGFFMDDGYNVTKQLLASGQPLPEAISAANDNVAIGALRALEEKGIEVPRDVSIAGYGDTDMGRNFGLTSVRQFPERMGSDAVQLLLAPRPLTAADSIEIDPEIVVRSSTSAR